LCAGRPTSKPDRAYQLVSSRSLSRQREALDGRPLDIENYSLVTLFALITRGFCSLHRVRSANSATRFRPLSRLILVSAILAVLIRAQGVSAAPVVRAQPVSAAPVVSSSRFSADSHQCKCGMTCRGNSCCCGPRHGQEVEPSSAPTPGAVRVLASSCLIKSVPCGNPGLPNSRPDRSDPQNDAIAAAGRLRFDTVGLLLVRRSTSCQRPARRASRLDRPPDHQLVAA
jgi:hypothetical protein